MKEEKGTAPEATSCAFGSDDCPCLEPDIDHVFIHMKRLQIECHACGAREDIPLPGKLAVLQAMVEQHERCERKGAAEEAAREMEEKTRGMERRCACGTPEKARQP